MQISLRRKRSIRRSVADNCEAFPKSLPAEPMAVWEASRSDAREAAHNQEACRGGFQTRPSSANTARENSLGHPPTAEAYSRCKRECDPTLSRCEFSRYE